MQNEEIYKNFNRILAAMERANYFLALITQDVNRYCAVQNVWFMYVPVMEDVSYQIGEEFVALHHVTCNVITQDGSQNIYTTLITFPVSYLNMSDNNITMHHYSSELLKILESLEEEKEALEAKITNIQAGYKLVYDARSRGIEFKEGF